MVEALPNQNARALLNVKALTSGKAEAAVPGGELQPMVNGQLVAMVNGQLRALVNGQLRAIVNNVVVDVNDITFQMASCSHWSTAYGKLCQAVN